MSDQATQQAQSKEPTLLVEEQLTLRPSGPQKPKTKFDLKQFLGLHSRGFTMLAVSVVIITFLVKDVYRDDRRELRVSISQAENMFRTREAFILMRMRGQTGRFTASTRSVIRRGS